MRLPKSANAPVPTAELLLALTWDAPLGVDVDVSVLMLTGNGKVRSDADFVFFNQPDHRSGAASLLQRRAAGSDSLRLTLPRVETEIERIVVIASAEGAPFSRINDVTIALSAAGSEVASYAVEDATSETAMVLGEVYRRQNAWKFRAIGQGYASGLAGVATDFGIVVDDPGSEAPAPAPPVPIESAPTPPTNDRHPAAVHPSPNPSAVHDVGGWPDETAETPSQAGPGLGESAAPAAGSARPKQRRTVSSGFLKREPFTKMRTFSLPYDPATITEVMIGPDDYALDADGPIVEGIYLSRRSSDGFVLTIGNRANTHLNIIVEFTPMADGGTRGCIYIDRPRSKVRIYRAEATVYKLFPEFHRRLRSASAELNNWRYDDIF